MMLTIDRTAILSNLMIAYKRGDLSKYLQLLSKCEKWMDSDLYAFYFNLSKSKAFLRKGYYDC